MVEYSKGRFGPYGLKSEDFSRGGRVFQKTAFLRHFLKFNLDFKKKFYRYDLKIYRGVEEFLGEHFPIYRMLTGLFNMSAEGGLLSWGVQKPTKNSISQWLNARWVASIVPSRTNIYFLFVVYAHDAILYYFIKNKNLTRKNESSNL